MTEARTVPTMEFIGVTTASSSIMGLFPRWARVLGLGDVRITGRDLPLDATPQMYREAVALIKSDPNTRGALVTTHKIRLLEAARDLFDELDPNAVLCGEVSSISKRDGRLIGHAKDPITAGRALETVLRPNHFAGGGEALIIGAGGAGTAITVYLLSREDRPGRIVTIDPSAERLAALRGTHAQLETSDVRLEYLENADPMQNDRVLAALEPESLVVNASGLGKDRPGSPITDAALFPMGGVAWELNYRGSLEFLHQAQSQRDARNLRVEDGWLYFLHGWSEVVLEVFGLEWTPERFAALSEEAERSR
jgi:shikimate 5-dehydrogenase